MEEKITYIEISTKLDRIIQLLEGLTHTQPTSVYRGIEVGGPDPAPLEFPDNFCTCGQTGAACPIHGATITKCYDD